jgi:hypothetical protein
MEVMQLNRDSIDFIQTPKHRLKYQVFESIENLD